MKQVLKHKIWLTFVLLLGTCSLMLTACKNQTANAPEYTSISDNKGTKSFGSLSSFVTISAYEPQGVRYVNGNLWVSGYDDLLEFSKSGNQELSTSSGSYYDAVGNAVDPKTSNVYVADYDEDKVIVYSSTGTYLTDLPYNAGSIYDPVGIAVNATGTKLYVTNYEEVASTYFGSIFNISGSAASPTLTFAGNFGAYGVLNYPYGGISFDSTGNLWVSNFYGPDYSGPSVAEFSSTGTVLNTYTSPDLYYPSDVLVTATGDFLVTDYDYSWVVAFNSKGTEIAKFGAGLLDEPMGITTDGSGDYYVADYSHSRILGFN